MLTEVFGVLNVFVIVADPFVTSPPETVYVYLLPLVPVSSIVPPSETTVAPVLSVTSLNVYELDALRSSTDAVQLLPLFSLMTPLSLPIAVPLSFFVTFCVTPAAVVS